MSRTGCGCEVDDDEENRRACVDVDEESRTDEAWENERKGRGRVHGQARLPSPEAECVGSLLLPSLPYYDRSQHHLLPTIRYLSPAYTSLDLATCGPLLALHPHNISAAWKYLFP